MLITAWAVDLARVLEIEQDLGDKLPWLALRDSGINLRTVKRVGWILDENGYATGQLITPMALQPAN